jgi:endoglucanase
MTLEDRILALSNLAGPAGFEEAAAARVREMLSEVMDEVHTDVMGSVVALRRCGKEKAPRLLIDAHIDEIGFVVTGHEEGFLRFAAIGGVDARMLPAAEIRILTEPNIVGVVAATPPHVLEKDESNKAIKIENLFIDVGLTQEEAEKAIPVGTPAVYNAQARVFGEGQICGKALDDRACLAVILEALHRLKDKPLGVDLYVLASTQEELGRRGAKTAAFDIAPDWCIVLDVDHAKTPDSKRHSMRQSGSGCVISVGPNMNRKLTNKAIQLAKDREIPYQIGVEAGDSGTNAAAVQIAREGVATALLGIPVKYMHSPVETLALSDAEAAADLLTALIESITEESADA